VRPVDPDTAVHSPSSGQQLLLSTKPAPKTPLPKPKPRAKAKPRRTSRRLAHSELSLLWGLLYDLVRAPAFLVLLLLGKVEARAALLPLHRVSHFVLSARATTVLIALNILCFAVEVLLQKSWPAARFWDTFAFSPQSLWQGRLLPLCLHVFSHASLPHLLSNMLALFVFGRVIEGLLGPWRLLLAYGVAAIAATLTSLLAQGLSGQYVPTLGASGAVAGLIALGVLLSPLTITFEALIPMPLFLVGWLAMAGDLLALWSKSNDSVDHPAHLGGYLSVALVYRVLPSKLKAKARFGLLLNVLTILFAMGLWYLNRSGPLVIR
jgi:membrane associated rhomboid family serine protease